MSAQKQKLKQLQTLLKLKEAEKQSALKQLSMVRQQFDHVKSQLDKMVQYRYEYQCQIKSIGEAGCNINKMRHRIVFIKQLDEGIQQLNKQLAMIAKQRKQYELDLIDKQRRVQSVEKLIESRKQEAVQAANKLEQKENDEYARKQWYNDNS